MGPLLLYLLTALLLHGAGLVAAQHTCDDCTVVPHLPCKVKTGPAVCNMPLIKNSPEVGPVRNLMVQPEGMVIDKEGQLYRNISWEIPTRGYNHVTGFVIRLFSADTPNICYHLDMTNAKWIENDNNERRRIYYDCLKVDWQRRYIVKIESLPNQQDISEEARIQPLVRPPTIPSETSPSEWTTSVQITPDKEKREIHVNFDRFVHATYSFTSYRVTLFNKEYPKNTTSKVVYTETLTMPIVFHDVCAPGNWRARVQPNKMGDELCLENGLICINEHGICKPCKRSTSEYLWFEPDNPCLPVPTEMKKQLAATVIGICAGCFLASILVAVAIYYSKSCLSSEDGSYSSEILPEGRNNSQKPGKPIVASNKTVLLLYEEDHELHAKAVHQFACFLQQHCMADIILDQWEINTVRKDPTAWLLKHLDTPDIIIVIHSEGGFKRYYAKKRGEVYKAGSFNAGRFVPGVEMIINERLNGNGHFRSSKKTLSAYMPYTPVEFVIKETSPSFVYQLMTDLEALVHHIHGAMPDSHLKGISEKVCHKGFKDLSGGRDLYDAINRMKRFTEENPNWFSDSHDKFAKDENSDSGHGTLQPANIGKLLRDSSISSNPSTAPLLELSDSGEVRAEEVEMQKKEAEVPQPQTSKDNRRSAEQRESLKSNSHVSLLRQKFEEDSFKRPSSKHSQTSKSSKDNLSTVPEALYAQPLPRSARSSKASQRDFARHSDARSSRPISSPSESSTPVSQVSSTEPLYAEVPEAKTPQSQRRSEIDYDNFVDSNFNLEEYGHSTGDPES